MIFTRTTQILHTHVLHNPTRPRRRSHENKAARVYPGHQSRAGRLTVVIGRSAGFHNPANRSDASHPSAFASDSIGRPMTLLTLPSSTVRYGSCGNSIA